MTIPKIVMQTGFSENNESDAKKSIIEKNPEYTYEYYNDNQCIKFISEYFSQLEVDAFIKLKPGAFKADFFRYCYLYKNGGVYIDLDLIPNVPLNKIIMENVDFISCLENRPKRNINGIYQAFIACKKGLYLFKNAIDKIVYYTQINYYPIESTLDIWINILSVTGPVLLYESFNFKEKPNIGLSNINGLNIYLYIFNKDIYDGNKVIIKNGNKYEKSNNYKQLFLSKSIYN